MIEKIVIDYLNTQNIGSAFAEVPVKPSSPKYIVVERTGGSISNTIETATIAIQSYDESLYKAAQLNELVKTAMLNITASTEIMACYLNSDYNFTNATTKQYRYQAVFTISI